MKRFLLFLLPLFLYYSSFSATTTISTVGFAFSPADVTIHQGDTIIFNVDGGHTATEVSSSTWGSNGITSNGGFNLLPGANQEVNNLSVGVHFYVCQVHVGSMGMKGKITVDALSGVKNITADDLLKIYPNPTKDYIYFDAKEDIKKIVITSIDGKISKEINTGKNTTRVLISDLPDNTYIFSAYTKKDEVYTKEFVKGE